MNSVTHAQPSADTMGLLQGHWEPGLGQSLTEGEPLLNKRHRTALLSHSEITDIVVSSLTDVLEMTANSAAEPPDLGGETRLIGRGGMLDSMGLVNLVVDIEQRLEEEHDIVVVLADERAMSQERSPFRSVGTLADYVCQLIGEQC